MNEHTNNDEVPDAAAKLRDMRSRNLLDWSDDKIAAVLSGPMDLSPTVLLNTMRSVGLDDDQITQAVPDLVTDAGIHAWAESIDFARIPSPVEPHRIELTESMRAVEDSSLWLEASDPEACRADLIRLAEAKFRAWVQAVS